MKKTTKFISILLIVIGIGIVGLIVFSRLLAPTFVKTELTKQVYQLTGHSLVINGDIHWSFFPWLGVKVQDVVMNNNSEFGKTPLAKADNIQLNVKLIPLFSHRLEVGTIFINGFNIYLIKNSAGKTNWDHFLSSDSTSQDLGDKKEDSQQFTIHQIESINFAQGKILFDDQQKHKNMEFNGLAFSAKNIALNKAFPFNLSFYFKQSANVFSGNLKINGILNIDDAKNVFNFSDLIFDGSFNDAEKKSNFHATGNLEYIAKNARFSLTQLAAKLNDYTFSGTLTGTFNPTLSAHGRLQSTALLVGGFLFKNVQTAIEIKNAIISLNSLTANLYQGNYTGDILVDTRPMGAPTVTLNGMLTRANVGQLFTSIMHKNDEPFTGMVDMSSMLKFTLGNDMRKTLNGNITVRLQNGVLHGINLPALIELGQAIVKRTALPNVVNNQTDFGTIKGTFQIQNGVMFNRDLTLQSSQLTANGQGTINLVNEQIDYHLIAGLVGHKAQVPILIRGDLDHPMIAPDAAQIAKETLTDKFVDVIAKATKSDSSDESTKKRELKEKLGNELKKLNLGSLLG